MEKNEQRITKKKDNKPLLVLTLLTLTLLPFLSSFELNDSTLIQTSGTGYNFSVIIDSNIDLLNVTSTQIIINNPSFLALENVDGSNGIINLNELSSAIILFSNGTKYYNSGNISITIPSGLKIYISNNGDIILNNGLNNYNRFNENSGNTIYDISGNNNDGSISGSIWHNDGVLLTMIQNLEYSINDDLFTIINENDYWRELNTEYQYNTWIGALTIINISDLSDGFGAFILGIITFLGIIGVIIGIIWLFYYIKPLFSAETGIQSFTGA